MLTAMRDSTAEAWVWGGVYILLGVLIPFFYVVWLVKQGHITTIDVRVRKQRVQPLLMTASCAGLAWVALVLGAAPKMMTVLAGALWFEAVVILAITLRWKISVHAATAAGAATMAWALLGTPLPFLGVSLVVWSRVRLQRHTLSQTVTGLLLGFAIFFSAVTLMP
jgi:membrane-associated phospholipid phosphatase